jgi:hypothetical protein
VSSTEVIQRAAATALQVKIPIASAMASTPNPSVGEECQKADLNMEAPRLEKQPKYAVVKKIKLLYSSISTNIRDYSSVS